MKKVAFSSIIFCFSLILVLKATEHYGAVRDNSEYYGPNRSTSSTVTQAKFNQVIDQLEVIYKPVVDSQGARLVMLRDWEDGTVNAFADRDDQEWQVKLFGGYARYPGMTPDTFALIVCHEIGHHLGGLPKKLNYWGNRTWASAEGQSDYFASAKCMKLYLADKNNIEFVSKLALPSVVINKCKEVYKQVEAQALCMRIAKAGEQLAKIRVLKHDSNEIIDLDSPDVTTVSSTIVSTYPSSQCRADTHFQAALCNANPTISANNYDIHKGYCSRKAGHELGTRPLCWFFPEKTFSVEEAVELFVTSCEKGNIQLVELALSSSELDVNKAGRYGKTALQAATEWGRVEIVKLLLKHPQIDVNKADKYGSTALISAVIERKIEIVKLLLEHPSIDVNKRDEDGDTALSIALVNNFSLIVKSLRTAGALD